MRAIEVAGLRKVYRSPLGRNGQTALDGVDLQIERGTAFGLIGQNGAGKTTFIKLLLGIARPTAGTVRVLGGDPEDPAIRARIGYLPERLHLPDAFRPRQFLESVARLKRLSLDRRALDALLQRVGLGPDADRRIGGFSKGMRQRLGLAAALMGDPALLVLDEPTDGIDPLGRMEIRRILGDEIARGVTLFLNSHLLAETERVCHRVGILAAGRLVAEGPLEALRAFRRSWRVRFSDGVDAAQLATAGFTRIEGTGAVWRFVGDDAAALNAALDRVRATGALLLGLEPESRDLEQVLADALGAAA